MRKKEIVIVGAGPAGLSAALTAAEAGAEVLLLNRFSRPGGQLVKQTHRFFGSEKEYAMTRGFEIAEILAEEMRKDPRIEFMTATALGLYSDRVLTVLKGEEYSKIKGDAFIIATGASEKFLAFENNDLPGIYGAGAVQTLMNVHGVRPGKRVLMVGSGNIGLIVSYQLLQAGIEVAAVLEAAPKIGGYQVHAAKLLRLGVPIKTSRTIKKALGTDRVEGAVSVGLDKDWNEIPGSEETYEVDAICIAVGLKPLAELAEMAGAEMLYVPELGGKVPLRRRGFATTVPWVFVAGDASGIEEASSAIIEGRLAGLEAASYLGKTHPKHSELEEELLKELEALRSGPFGEKYRRGLKKLEERYV